METVLVWFLAGLGYVLGALKLASFMLRRRYYKSSITSSRCKPRTLRRSHR